MKTEEILSMWSRACALVDVKWFLYKETLLCANGYGAFPDNLSGAQVVVFSEDVPVILESVIPLLPRTWVLDKKELICNQRKMSFVQEGNVLLTVDVLYPVADEEHMIKFTAEVNAVRKKAAKKIRMRDLCSRLMGKLFGKLLAHSQTRIAAKAFSDIVSLSSVNNTDASFYCDSITSKKPALMDKHFVADGGTVECGGVLYPVFSGYRTYLEHVYGDYENGLTDGIGVGLTLEEKEALKQHQMKCKDALVFLQELSKEFGLRYYLIAGSVLGPMRHGGFIPWDDDVDIGIRVEELEYFEKVVKEELPKRLPAGFTLEQSGVNNPYPRMFSKICYEGRCCVDLWPLIPTYMRGYKAVFTWYFAKIITKAHYYKIGHKVNYFYRPAKMIGMVLSDRQIMALARWNERKYINKKTPAYINVYSIYKRGKETIKREWLDTPETLCFDGVEVPVVGCAKQYLVHLYGNYMGYPAPWKRVSRHVARFHTAESDVKEKASV